MENEVKLYRQEIFDLTQSLIAAAKWIGSTRWQRFCKTTLGLEMKERGPSPEFLRHAERIFVAGFKDGYLAHGFARTNAGFDLADYMQESWVEFGNDDDGNYAGNTASSEPFDTVPYREARLLFFIGEQEAAMILAETWALTEE